MKYVSTDDNMFQDFKTHKTKLFHSFDDVADVIVDKQGILNIKRLRRRSDD